MPSILGTIADQPLNDLESIDPFSFASISDSGMGETEMLTITLSNAANGVLSNLAGGTYDALTGVYTLSGPLATVNSAFEGLVFTPTAHQAAAGQLVTTTFTVTDGNTSIPSPASDATTSVATTATAAPAAIDTSSMAQFFGVNYGPFQGAESPGGSYPTAAQLAADIPTLSGMANAIRLYSVSNGIGAAVADAADDGLRVVPSVQLVNPEAAGGAVANDGEINNLIALLNNPSTDLADIPFVVVGDDFLQANPTQYNYLISEIQYVRAHAPSSVKITTAETSDDYLANFPALGSQVDLVFADVDPFEQSTPVSLLNAPGFVAAEYDTLEEHYAGEHVVLAGTGWPSAGVNGSDVGGIANQQTFWTQFDALAKQDNISFFGPEAFDEPYRTGGGIDGPSAGLYNANRTPKGALTTLVPVDGDETITLATQPGNSASLYNTGGNWDSVGGSNGSVYLSAAQSSVFGGGDHVSFVAGAGNAAGLHGTGGDWDMVSGSNGTIWLASAQTSVVGGDDTIYYAGGTGNVVSLYNTSGAPDAVSASGGPVYLTSAQASVAGGSNLIYFVSGSGNSASLSGTDDSWDLVQGSNGVINLASAQASVFGGDDTINFTSGPNNAASLYQTNGVWDLVSGSSGLIYLTSSQASVFGGFNAIDFSSGTDNAASLYQTNGEWDAVTGSGGTVYLTSAQASVLGGDDTFDFSGGTDDAVSLYQSNGARDFVNGSNGFVYLTSAQATVLGGDDTVDFATGTGNLASLRQTNGDWDTVAGSGGTVLLTNAQASIFGGRDTIGLSSGVADNAAGLYNTNGFWDTVNGSNAVLYLVSAQTSVDGGDDTIYFSSGSGNAASLADTGISSDVVNGSGGQVDLYSATATVTGSDDAIDFFGNNVSTFNGVSETLAFQQGIGGSDFITGFDSTDTLQLSKSDFVDFNALSSHLSQLGADTVITLDPNDAITLKNVAASSLTSAQFDFA